MGASLWEQVSIKPGEEQPETTFMQDCQMANFAGIDTYLDTTIKKVKDATARCEDEVRRTRASRAADPRAPHAALAEAAPGRPPSTPPRLPPTHLPSPPSLSSQLGEMPMHKICRASGNTQSRERALTILNKLISVSSACHKLKVDVNWQDKNGGPPPQLFHDIEALSPQPSPSPSPSPSPRPSRPRLQASRPSSTRLSSRTTR